MYVRSYIYVCYPGLDVQCVHTRSPVCILLRLCVCVCESGIERVKLVSLTVRQLYSSNCECTDVTQGDKGPRYHVF